MNHEKTEIPELIAALSEHRLSAEELGTNMSAMKY